MNKRFTQTVCGAVILLMLVLTGCQTVGGVDLGKAAENALTVQSFEGSVDVKLSASGFPEAPGAADWNALNGLQLVVDSLKMENQDRTSAAGKLVAGQEELPFALSTDNGITTLMIEGAKQPVAFAFDPLTSAMKGSPVDLSRFGDPKKLLKTAAPLLAAHLPNVSSLTVAAAKEKVHNETLDLNKIHLELKGSELSPLLKKFLGGVSTDELGLQALAETLIGPQLGGIAVPFIQDALIQAGLKLDEASGALFTDKLALKADLYTDDKLQIRKAVFELKLPVEDKKSGSAGGTVTASGTAELWNVNGTVKADAKPAGEAFDLGESGQLFRIVKVLDKDSALYDLLVNDLHVQRKAIRMHMPAGLTEAEATKGEPFIKDGSTLVPVRFVSEELGADVAWDGDKYQVTVTDILNGTKVILTINDTEATAGGQQATLEVPAQLVHEKTYVPVRFIAESLGAKVGWDEETRTVSIVRN